MPVTDASQVLRNTHLTLFIITRFGKLIESNFPRHRLSVCQVWSCWGLSSRSLAETSVSIFRSSSNNGWEWTSKLFLTEYCIYMKTVVPAWSVLVLVDVTSLCLIWISRFLFFSIVVHTFLWPCDKVLKSDFVIFSIWGNLRLTFRYLRACSRLTYY